jgi:hypothetical protein
LHQLLIVLSKKYKAMNTMKILTALLLCLLVTQAFCKNPHQTEKGATKETVPYHRFSFSTTYLTFANFGDEKTNTHHYEFHLGYKLTPNDRIGIKVATWKLFAPMGLPIQEQLKFDENNFYPGRLRESGIGVTYQRMIWKGLFATIEILPQLKTYLDENEKKIGNGFKLYTTYHLGYHISLFKHRMYIEPQLHCNYWPIDTKIPQSFNALESKWNNYILFEPNLYIGINF